MTTVRKYNKLLFVLLIAAALLLSAFVMLSATNGSTAQNTEPAHPPVNARAVLDSVQGRQFPNLTPPRDDLVAKQAAGIPLDAEGVEVDQALDKWYGNFAAKNEKSGANPLAYAERMAALEAAQSAGKSPAEVDPITGTAKMLMVPIQFTGTDNIPGCAVLGGPQTFTATVQGPLFGTIPDPSLEGDNNTIWDPNMDVQWYRDLMFGNGVGVVRTDLNGGAGVDLTGVSATNWYLEQSEGLYQLSGDIFTDVVTLDHSVAWYGWDGDELDPQGRGYPCDGTPSGLGNEFVNDTIDKINQLYPNFDWSQYDVHGPGDQGPPDGIVDHFMIIHAGVDNSAGGGTYGNYQLWAHSWDAYTPHYSGTVAVSYTLGYLVQGGDTATTTDDIYIVNYTHIPEDADIGVVVHEYGHDIGLPDYYDTSGATSNSTAHWIVMSGGSWSGDLGGSHPAPFNPWARYFFGWETPTHVNYRDSWEGMIGQSEPTPLGTEDSVWIDLPNQETTVDNMAGTGKGLHAMLGDQVVYTLTKEFDLSSATTPVFTFNTYYIIETDWDYTYIQASTDGGANWTTLLNNEGQYATVDPNSSFAWWGPGGLTGSYAGSLTYDLSAYAGQSSVMIRFAYVTDQAYQDPGIWVDDLTLSDGATVLDYSDLETSNGWTNTGWEEVPYNNVFSQYYMLEWRNDSGSIAQHGQTQQYNSLVHSGDGWNVDKFPASVPGLLVWYRNNYYSNNNPLAGGRYFDAPATGPKGELLLVDSHSDPIPWSGGWWNAGALSNRRGAMDGSFTLNQTPAWMLHDAGVISNTVMDFGSRPAVSSFNDGTGYVPGWVFNSPFVYRYDQASSVVIPAAGDYSTRIRSLGTDGNAGADLTAFWGFTVGGQVLGSGNPGDNVALFGGDPVQFGVDVTLLEQATDGSWGKIAINTQNTNFAHSVDPTSLIIDTPSVYTITYQTVASNTDQYPAYNVAVTYTLDSALNLVDMYAMGSSLGTTTYPTGTVNLGTVSWWTDVLNPGDAVTITLVTTGTVGLNGTGSLPLGQGYTVNTWVSAFDGLYHQDPINLQTTISNGKVYLPLVMK